MAIPAGDKTLLETHPHKVKFYLVVHQPETVLAARVNDALTEDPVVTITFDTVTSGAWGNIEAGQTLLIGSASGTHDKGICRIRSATSTILTIAEHSDLRGVANNDYLTVLREHRFWIKYPRIVDVDNIFEDYNVTYVDENTAFPPVPMMGPCGFGFLDGATLDFDYDFSESYPIAGSSIDTYATTYEDGDGGSSAADTHTETYSAATGMKGSETKLTVTDDNGKSKSAWRYDFVLDRTGADSPVKNWSARSVSNIKDSHETVDFVIYDSVGQTILRDGTRVWIIYESWYGDTQKEIPNYYTNRANILFEGWVIGDTIRFEKDHTYVTFTANPITKMIDMGRAFPATLQIADSPGGWYEVSSCTVIKATLYILQQRCNLTEIVDVHVPTTTIATAGEDWGENSIESQVEEAINDELMFLSQSKEGQIWIEKIGPLMTATERGALDDWITLEKKHGRSPMDIKEEIIPRLAHVFAEGVYYNVVTDTGIPYFSESPGLALKYRGDGKERVSQLALSNQAHLNQISGDVLAMKNAKYPGFTLQMTGFWTVFDPVPQKKIVVSGFTSDRGSDLSGLSFLVDSVKYSFEKGMCQTEIVLVELTDGVDGRTVSYPTEVPATVEPLDPPPIPPEEGHYRGVIFATNPEGSFYTDEFVFTSLPTWVDMQNDELVAAGSKNVWSIRQVLYGDGVEKLFALCYCGFYEYNPMPPGSGNWTQRVKNYEIATLAGVVATQGYVMMDTVYSVSNPGHAWGVLRTQAFGGPLGYGFNLVVCHTHDGWQTLVEANSVIYNNDWHGRMARAQIAIANDGTDEVLFLSWQSAHSGGGSWGVKKSIDGGTNWADSFLDGCPAYAAPITSLYCPYSNLNYVYAACGEGVQEFVYSTDGGASWSSPYSLASAYPMWLTGPPTDETVLTMLDQKRALYEWDGVDFNEWGEYYDWWEVSDPDTYGGFARGVRVLERDSLGGLVKAIIGGYDRADKGKILLMEVSGRTVVTENWNTVANNDWINCISLPAMISEILDD